MIVSRPWRSMVLLLLPLAVLLAAWLVHGAQPPAPPSVRELLVQVFPAWPAQAAGAVQPLDWSGLHAGPKDAQATQAWVAPLGVVALDDTHAALLTRALRVGDDGQPDDCHACSAVVGAYFFHREGAHWQLAARQDAVVEAGAQGSIGTTQLHRVGDGQYVLSADWGSCWQGVCGSWLTLVGLRPDHATVLSDGVRLSVDNDGVAGACSALDRHTRRFAAGECLDIHSTWKLDGRDLAVHFNGRIRVLGAHRRLRPVQRIDGEMVYRLSAGSMVLLKGRDPVPAL